MYVFVDLVTGGVLTLVVEIRLYRNDKLNQISVLSYACLLYTSPSPRDAVVSRMPSSA